MEAREQNKFQGTSVTSGSASLMAIADSKLTLNELDFRRTLTTSSEDVIENFRDSRGVEARSGPELKGSTILQISTHL